MGSHDEAVAVITSLTFLSSHLNMRSNYLVVLLGLLLHLQVQGDPDPGLRTPARGSFSHQEQLTKYLLSKLLGSDQSSVSAFSERRNSESSDKFPLKSRDPLQKLLDHAKANIDVIDFRNPNRKYYDEDHLRLPRRQPQDLPTLTDDLTYGSQPYKQQNPRSSSPSEASLTFLPFPGNEKARPTRQAKSRVSPAIASGSNEPFSMPTGTRRSSIAGTMGCTWPASTPPRSRRTSRITSPASAWATNISGAAGLTLGRRGNSSGCPLESL